MRQSLRPLGLAGVVLLAGTAIAATITHTNSADWSSSDVVNITVSGTLALTNDDDGAVFSHGDYCLVATDNTYDNTSLVNVNGMDYRAGTHRDGSSPATSGSDDITLATIPPFSPVDMPGVGGRVTSVYFLTAGGHGGASSYTVRFNYVGGGSQSVNVPIQADSVTGSRAGSGANYQKIEVIGFVGFDDPAFEINADGSGYVTGDTADTGSGGSGPTESDCNGNGGDEVIVDNPNPNLDVASIQWEYPEFDDGGAVWLGGPVAVTIEMPEDDHRAAVEYTGTYNDIDGGIDVDDAMDACASSSDPDS